MGVGLARASHIARQPIWVAVAFLGVWQLISGLEIVSPFWISSPQRAANALWNLTSDGTIFVDLLRTLTAAFVGLGLGIVGSVPIVALLSVSRFTERTFQPIVDFIYSIPKVALIPVLVLTFGVGRVSEIFLIFLFVVFIFVYNFQAGLREVDPRLLDAMKNLGMSQIGLITNVRIPVLLSYGMAGLRIGIPTAITGAIFVEYFSGQTGIGKLIYQSAISFQMDYLIAGVAALVPVAYAFDILLRRLDSRLSAWRAAL